jgi:DNA end-binding protein Ku
MARPIWKGAITFGLVTVPVSLYSATQREEHLSFRLLHDKDRAPIDYRRFCSEENVEVEWKDVVKGYEYEKGHFVVMTDADFEKARTPATQAIEIRDFVPAEQIDFAYFDTPYWVEPTKPGRHGYVLLREALEKSARVGIATFVMRQREHLAALRPAKDALMLTTMRFAHEIRGVEGLDIPADQHVEPRQLSLALQLVDTLAADFKPEQYRDTYTAVLRRAIEQKLEGKEIRIPGPKQPARVVDLVKALEASLEEGRKPPAKVEAPRERAPRRKAASRRKRRVA